MMLAKLFFLLLFYFSWCSELIAYLEFSMCMKFFTYKPIYTFLYKKVTFLP